MIDSTFHDFVKNKQYAVSNSFNNNTSDLLKLLAFIKNLPLAQDSFQMAKDLMKFYRISIFIAFAPLYERLEADPSKEKYENEVKEIASFVKGYLKENKLNQLNFFFCMGLSSKKKKSPPRSEPENQFIEYVEKLGNHLSSLKKNINTYDEERLKLEIDSILAQGLHRKLNPLEVHYEQFFKAEADKIYNQNKMKIEKNVGSSNKERRPPSPKPDYNDEVTSPMCCRTFFFRDEIIKQPENLLLQYKNYRFPFDEERANILKKTICGFLNTDGGIIFLGIQENVDTKLRKIYGMQLNENEKENLMRNIREIANQISPDITMNKMYAVSFIPVKSDTAPYHFIAGRCVAKIVIKYGKRDQIYSYRLNNQDYFSFRTENEIIHREGREVLNALRERIKNPLPDPLPVHEGPCRQPEKGDEIYDIKGKFQRRNNGYGNGNGFFYGNENGNINGSPNSNKKMGKKYRQKEAMDYVVVEIKEKDLLKELRLKDLDSDVTVTSDEKLQVCFLKIKDQNSRQTVWNFLESLREERNYQSYAIERGITFEEEEMAGVLTDILGNQKVSFKMDDNLIRLSSTEDSIKAFLVMREMKLKVQFFAI